MRQRLRALQSALGDAGVALAVVGPSMSMRYLTGHRPMAFERLTLLLVTPEAAAAVVPQFDVPHFEGGFPGLVLGWRDDTGPAGAVERGLAELGGAPGLEAWAVDDELPAGMLLALTRGATGPLASLSPLLWPLRMRKDEGEIAALHRAGAGLSSVMSGAGEIVREGMTERDLARALTVRLLQAGADDVGAVLVQAGPNAAIAHHDPGERRIARGEAVLLDISASFEGYFADMTRQLCIGEPPAAYRDAYELARASHEAACAAIRLGAPLGDLAAAANAVLREAGEQAEGRIGHGIGLSIHEPPSLTEDAQLAMEPGLAFSVEPGVYRAGELGIRIEDTIVIGRDGPERTTHGPHELLIV